MLTHNSIAVTADPGDVCRLPAGVVSLVLMCGYAAVAILCGGVLLRHRDA